MRRLVWTLCVVCCLSLFAEERVPARFGGSETPRRAFPAPVLRGAKDVVSLDRLSAQEIDAIKEWNDAGNIPMRNGVVRPLPRAMTMDHRGMRTTDTFRWSRTVRVEGASQLRLQLAELRIPPDAVFWVYGEGGEAIAFDATLAEDGVLWTPSVFGETITLEVAVGGGSPASFEARQVAQLVEAAPSGSECFQDAACHGAVTDFASAVGRMSFIDGSRSYLCSGSLIADRDATFTPYFLTVNHCVSTPAAAATVEVHWDYRRSSCEGSVPPLSTRPRSNGAALLATSEGLDITLLQLVSVPGPRTYLGWDSTAVPNGTRLQRISHPRGQAQIYSETTVSTAPFECEGWWRPEYLYSTRTLGAIDEGSSGSPAFYDDGYIVGQLSGSCGPEEEYDNLCSDVVAQVDGAMATSFFAVLAPFLDPVGGCVANATTTCLLENRFRVTINYRNQFSNPPGQTGDFTGARLNPAATNPDTAIFGFSNPQDVEVVVRIVDARPFAPRFDVYYGGLTDVEYWLHVTDTVTGTTRQYYNEPNRVGGGVDRVSFPAE